MKRMKLYSAHVALILAAAIIFLPGCADLGGAIVGGIAGGVYAGLTGDEQGGYQLADAVHQSIKEESERQRLGELQKQHEEKLLARLPEAWKCPGSQLYQDDNGCYIYARPDQNWYRWDGNQWLAGE